jgi:succinate-semialdehyde dehydrogenase/glutarate-semialdehyde dehydrogenase
MLRSIDPATGLLVAEYPAAANAETSRALRTAAAAFASWRRSPIEHRQALLAALAQRLRAEAEPLALGITTEMGKPIREAKAEVEKCARACLWAAQHGSAFLQGCGVDLDGKRALVVLRPLGPLLAIMPWNFPLWQSVRAAAPALLVGNVVLLKLAASTTGCALALERLFSAAGFPPGVFTALRVPGSAMGRVLRHPAVAAVTFTGSTEAGRKVAATAGRALKKTVLELGGSDPYVVLEDADLDLAARVCAHARLINGGQSCIAAKRFIVVEPVLEAFTRRFVDAMSARRPADPKLESTELGPMARLDLREEVHAQVRRSIAAGARPLCGAEIPPGPGAFYPPTVLDRVRPGMPAFDEETFGPVAAVVAARDEADAVRLANRTAFGLGAAVFTRDVERGLRLAREELVCGLCAVNGSVFSDPRLPFGGVKDSGYGRELGEFGMHEFVNIQTVLAG